MIEAGEGHINYNDGTETAEVVWFLGGTIKRRKRMRKGFNRLLGLIVAMIF